MSGKYDDEDKNKDADHLSQVNEELNQSLQRCRDLLKSHRSQLAANRNDPEDDDEGESREA